MNPRIKQILLLSAFIAVTIGIAAAIYFLFFAPSVSPTPPTPGGGPTSGGLPTSGTAGDRPTTTPPAPVGDLGDIIADGGVTQVTRLTTGDVASVTLSSDGQNANFYNPDDGKFYTIDEDGNVVALSSAKFPEADSVEWSKDADKAVIEFPDGSNVVYDFSAETQVTLPAHWEDFEFSPVSDEIVAKSMGLDPNNRWLVVSNADGSRVESLHALGENADKVTVSWSPNDQVIAFSDTADQPAGGLDRQIILPVGKGDENFPGLVVEGLFFTPLWSPDGKQLLYSVVGEYSDNKPLLWIVDATSASMGEDRHSLGINTWADKCVYATSTTVYCAVPQGLPPNAGIQRRLYEDLPDSLYRLDLTRGSSTLIAIPADDTTMTSLSVTQDESLLYFINAENGSLESIRLK